MGRKKNSGLGRGLDAIFLDNAELEAKDGAEGKVSELSISLIDPKGDQPRKYFDREALDELAASIKENGLLQPILVREIAMGRYQIIAGERRFRASKLAGLSEIPAIVLDKSDREVAEIALIENIQREDLNPIEEARGFLALKLEYGLTQEEISLRVGKSRSSIANAMRLLDLPDEVITMVASGELSAGHAKALLGLNNKEDMILLAQHAAEGDMSVRALEEAVRVANLPTRPKRERKEDDAPLVDYVREMELRIQRELGRKAEIKARGKKKTLTLYYEDNEDLDELLKLLCGEAFFEEV